MPKLQISFASCPYDRLNPVINGRVPIEGCDINYITLPVEECFERAYFHREFDVAEIGFSPYLIALSRGVAPYVAVPAFLSRAFRHSAVYIRTDRGIVGPADLRGKRIGVPEYQITAVVWMRGMMEHQYGVPPTDIHWRSGGHEQAGREERTPLKPIPGLDLQTIPHDKTLVGMLRDGELDALFTARAPSSFLAGEAHIVRLFPNTRAAEVAYYKKTGYFPIMHLIGIRKSLTERYPWLATSVYKAFCEAKALAMINLRYVNALMVTLPWLEAETHETAAIMGEDFWKYGIAENRPEIEALTQYIHEQGLADRKVKVEELFHPATFDISKV